MREAIISYSGKTIGSLEHAIKLLEEEERKPGMKVYPNDNTHAISDLRWLYREIVKWETSED